MQAFSSPDSYGLVLLLILVTYGLVGSADGVMGGVFGAGCADRHGVGGAAGVPGAPIGPGDRQRRAWPRRPWRRSRTSSSMMQIHGGVVAAWVSCLLYLIAPVSIIRHLVVRRTVDSETVLGAIAAYLMAGMFFAFLYHALGLSSDAAAVLRVPGPRHVVAGPVLLVYHAHHHRVRQPCPGR